MNTLTEKTTSEQTVGSIVAEDYRTASIFKRFRIDFCCGGGKTLEAACNEKEVNQEELLQEIGKLHLEQHSPDEDFQSWGPSKLIDHIVGVHHKYLNEQLPVVKEFVDKVKRVHGERKPNVSEIADHFNTLATELKSHMQKEENILFPFIRAMEEANEKGQAIQAPFGSVENPIRMMMMEHDSAGSELEELRKLTENYTPPADACATHWVSYLQLKELEEDLMKHIHLENNILFPKALAMENELAAV